MEKNQYNAIEIIVIILIIAFVIYILFKICDALAYIISVLLKLPILILISYITLKLLLEEREEFNIEDIKQYTFELIEILNGYTKKTIDAGRQWTDLCGWPCTYFI